MAISLSFFLVYSRAKIARDKLSDKPVSIRAQVRYTRSHLNWSAARRLGHTIHRIQFTTPVKVAPRYWVGSRVRHNAPQAASTNAALDGIATRAAAAHSQYIDLGEFPDDNTFIAAMLGATEAAAQGPAGFFDYYDQYVQYLQDRKVKRQTTLRHRYILKRLAEFQRAAQYPLSFESINKTFASRFAVWAAQNLSKRRATQDTQKTVERYLKDIRNFLSHALSEGWTTSQTWRQIKIRDPRTKFPITVDPDEIARLHALSPADFPDRKPEAAANILITRDWFLLGTQTAMRWSDWNNRQFQFIQVSPTAWDMQFIQEKTDDPLQIPLSDIAIQILTRHNFAMPPAFQPASTMQHLRAIAHAAGITKHITTHTARRTFCTLQEAAGVPRSVIMRITGHRTEKDYLRYTGITFRFNADMLRKANPAMFRSA